MERFFSRHEQGKKILGDLQGFFLLLRKQYILLVILLYAAAIG